MEWLGEPDGYSHKRHATLCMGLHKGVAVPYSQGRSTHRDTANEAIRPSAHRVLHIDKLRRRKFYKEEELVWASGRDGDPQVQGLAITRVTSYAAR